MEINKLGPDKLHECREKGVDFDLTIEAGRPDVPEFDVPDHIDVEKERERAETPYWPSREKFVGQFNYKEMEGNLIPCVQNLLWSFRHVFHNTECPEQFHEGIRVPPVKIERIPGAIPRKEKVRQMSDRKLEYLKKHVQDMVAQNMLRELLTLRIVTRAPCTLS